MHSPDLHQESNSSSLIDRFERLRQVDQLHLFGRLDFLALIRLHKEQESLHEAISVSDIALQYHLLDSEILTQKIDLLLENKHPQEALEGMAVLEQVGCDEITIVCFKVRAMFQLDETELAKALLAGIKAWAPESRKNEICLLEASLMKKAGMKQEAYLLYKEVLTRDPRNRTALEKIWLASESTRNQKDSLAFHLQLIDRDPYNGMAWFNAGQAYYYLLKYDEALEAFEYAGMLEPQFNLTFCFAAEVALGIGQPKRALKNLYDILQRSPDSGTLKLMGQSYLALQNYPKARQYYLQARNLDPLDDEIYFHLGKIYMYEMKPGIAGRYFERAVNLDDRNEDYIIALAEAWHAEGRSSEAEACLLRATELAPELPDYWCKYAEFKWRLNQYHEVLRITEEALDHTWGANLYFIRAAAQFALNDRANALRSLEEALGEEYESHETFFQYQPELRQDKDIKAILRYFALENA